MEVFIQPGEGACPIMVQKTIEIMRDHYKIDAKVCPPGESFPPTDNSVTISGAELAKRDEIISLYDAMVFELGRAGRVDVIIDGFAKRSKGIPIYHAFLGLLEGGHHEKARELLRVAESKQLSCAALLANCRNPDYPPLNEDSWKMIHTFLQGAQH